MEDALDTLSDVLNLMRLQGVVYFLRDFAGAWGMDMPDGPFAQFHLVVRGRCWLEVDGATTELSNGDVVVFPRGDGHRLLDAPGTEPVPGRTVFDAHMKGQPIFAEGETRAQLLCGHFAFDRAFKHPLVKELPSRIHIKGFSTGQPDWFEAVTRVLILEAQAGHPGGATVVDRLAEVLFVQVLRAYLRQSRSDTGFLAAIHDNRINRALSAIHGQMGSALTLDDIAREAGMSRSGLALKFKAILGETPMDYLTRWRMLTAQELLKTSGGSLPEIAESVGYRSESAFSHAFKRQFNQSPGSFRRFATSDNERLQGKA